MKTISNLHFHPYPEKQICLVVRENIQCWGNNKHEASCFNAILAMNFSSFLFYGWVVSFCSLSLMKQVKPLGKLCLTAFVHFKVVKLFGSRRKSKNMKIMFYCIMFSAVKALSIQPEYLFLCFFLISGDADSAIPFIATRTAISKLHLKRSAKWYPWGHNNKVICSLL